MTDSVRKTNEYLIIFSGALFVLLLPILLQVESLIPSKFQNEFLIAYFCILMSCFLSAVHYLFQRRIYKDYSSYLPIVFLSFGIFLLFNLSMDIIYSLDPILGNSLYVTFFIMLGGSIVYNIVSTLWLIKKKEP